MQVVEKSFTLDISTLSVVIARCLENICKLEGNKFVVSRVVLTVAGSEMKKMFFFNAPLTLIGIVSATR